MDPVQLTLSTCKLSLTPLPSGPLLEFTDFETDITWLSGPIYARLLIAENPSFAYHTLDSVRWEETEASLSVSGRLGPVDTRMSFHLKESPTRLEELITISNSSLNPISVSSLRIGSSWSPPKTWWAYWGYWRLGSFKADSRKAFSAEGSVSLTNLQEQVQAASGDSATQLVPIGDSDDEGWVFCDEKRFLVLCRRVFPQSARCPLDILFPHRPTPTLIMGGIRLPDHRGAQPQPLSPGLETVGDTTVFIPGRGGWDEAHKAYRVSTEGDP